MNGSPLRANGTPLLRVRDLRTWFPIRSGVFQRVTGWVRAVDGVSFDVSEGQTLALVGESGCGKTTVGHSILRLLTPQEGSVEFEGRIEAFRDDAGRLHVHGTLRVVELAEVLDRELPATDAETISGLVLLQLGRPAQVGDTVRYGPVRLVVIAVEGRGVKECLVQTNGTA